MSSTATRRGSHPRPKGRSQQPQDDTEEVRTLRSKYSDKLEMIRELFPTWTDEDLLFALQDALGDVELVVVRISDGLVEQFSSVKPKKQNKKETSASAPAANRSAPVSTEAPATTRSSDRGGRGRGGASVRGTRGGRGGSRGVGGRGGGIAPQANGHNARSPEESTTTPQSFSSIATPTSGTSWAAALGRSSKANGATTSAALSSAPVFADTSAPAPASDFAGGWDVDAPATESAPLGWDVDEPAAAAPVQATESATTTSALPSIVQESQPAVKVPAPTKSVPKSSTMSWAQIARKSEAPKPVAPVSAQPTETALEATPLAPSTIDAPAAPVSDFIAEVSAPVEEAPAVDAPAAEPEPIAAQPVAEPTIAEQVSAAAETDPAASAAAPPGLPKAVARGASQRTSQRARQDAPVVMAGGSSQLDKLGVQFGSLNFLGADDDDSAEQAVEAQTEQPAAVADAPSAASPPVARTQPALHDRLGQSQPGQDSYGQQGQYNGYKSDAFDSSYGFTGQSQQQQPAASHHQGPQDQVQGYNGFSSSGGSQNQQPQQDYSSMYGGLDTQRLAQFYGSYDQGSNAFGQRADDKAQQPSSQQQSGEQHTPQPQHPQGHQAGPGLHQQQAPQQQQQFPGIMPYYYPHYYMPNQFQHYGQPGGGYGQYPVYGQPAAQPQQHPSKPGTPANVASPYNQGGPQGDANNYGGSQYGHQTPSAANLSSYDQGFARNNMQGAPGLGGMSDYSKIYGGAIPGLSGFLGSSGGPPSQTGGSGNGGSGAAGTPHMSAQQKAGGASSGSALDSYRQFDANAGKPSGQAGGANQAGRGQQGQTQTGPQGQGQPHQGQQQQQQQQPAQQQQQQYYQQYGVYGHQGNSSAYSNYPYARQYWGQ